MITGVASEVQLVSGVFVNGVVAFLPVEAGTNPAAPPSMACYYSDNPSQGVWFVVASSGGNTFQPYCLLQFSEISGVWRAALLRIQPGQTAAFVIVY